MSDRLPMAGIVRPVVTGVGCAKVQTPANVSAPCATEVRASSPGFAGPILSTHGGEWSYGSRGAGERS